MKTCALSNRELRDLLEWCHENDLRLLNVCRFLAGICEGYNKPDERWAMSQVACDAMAKAFGAKVIRVAERQGFDLLFHVAEGRWIRISVKVEQHVFQEEAKKTREDLRPGVVVMTNPKSAASAHRQRTDFDALLVIQRGPLKRGHRNGRYVVRYGVVPNGEWLQSKYCTNKDSQQTVKITNQEWSEYGFLGSEDEVLSVVPPKVVRRVERMVRRHRLKALVRQIQELDADGGGQ